MKRVNLEHMIEDSMYDPRRCKNCGELQEYHVWKWNALGHGEAYWLVCRGDVVIYEKN